jgi:DNA-binding MarR family transcriptional regulator
LEYILENKRLFGKICYLHRQMRRDNNFLFAEYGLSPVQIHAMSYVHHCMQKGENICQKDIEKQINLRASSVSSLLSGLEKGGFIERKVSSGDARTKFITLTEKGLYVCEKNKQVIDTCDNIIESALEEDEKQQFSDLLDKIIGKIERR